MDKITQIAAAEGVGGISLTCDLIDGHVRVTFRDGRSVEPACQVFYDDLAAIKDGVGAAQEGDAWQMLTSPLGDIFNVRCFVEGRERLTLQLNVGLVLGLEHWRTDDGKDYARPVHGHDPTRLEVVTMK